MFKVKSFMGLPFNGLLRNLQFKMAGNPTRITSPFPTRNPNQRLAPGDHSLTCATRGKAFGTLGAGVAGGLVSVNQG